ncbi:MAG: HAMP domain-containing histidine kinase [Deltaproteobacteria bacterium]|nr:HAMP domain-containing histidine kinase [Deltaproteobacteria bacterium]
MRRLYHQIYLAFVAAVALFALLATGLWALGPHDFEPGPFLDGVADLIGDVLPSADRPLAEQRAAIDKLASRFPTDLTLRDARGNLIVAAGPELALPASALTRAALATPPGDARRISRSLVLHAAPGDVVAALALPDGRWLLVDHHRRRGHGRWPIGAALTLALLATAIAVAAYPVVRRLTGRLERLQARVEDLGRGNLGARVEVEGRDEVADLARSFNQTAERIERLVHAQKDALASASHELRSPLARIRVAVELLGTETRPDVRERIARDIAELDDLIGEILLTSRLDASPVLEHSEPVDMLALTAEEAAPFGAEVTGESATVDGDVRLLRRLLRNLFENAERYGAGSPIQAEARRAPASEGGGALVWIHDRGAGIPIEERERIFEPFYRRSGTSEGEGGGVGLGLALVRRIASSHGASVRALPREGGGTTIEVRFPSVPDPGS